jgi:hypothetical protein
MNRLCPNCGKDIYATSAVHVCDTDPRDARIAALVAENKRLREQLLMAASAIDSGKDGCQFVRVMDTRGRFICMAEVSRSASQSEVPLLEMSDRVGVHN